MTEDSYAGFDTSARPAEDFGMRLVALEQRLAALQKNALNAELPTKFNVVYDAYFLGLWAGICKYSAIANPKEDQLSLETLKNMDYLNHMLSFENINTEDNVQMPGESAASAKNIIRTLRRLLPNFGEYSQGAALSMNPFAEENARDTFASDYMAIAADYQEVANDIYLAWSKIRENEPKLFDIVSAHENELTQLRRALDKDNGDGERDRSR